MSTLAEEGAAPGSHTGYSAGGRRPITLLATCFLALLTVIASEGRGDEVRGNCDIRFHGSSTLHDFEGKARCRAFGVSFARDEKGHLALPRAEVEVPVMEMDTGNPKRDREMRGMFQADLYPEIRGSFRDIDAEGTRRDALADGGKAKVGMILRIRDVERTVPVGISNFREGPDGVSFDADIPVSLKEYGLKPPTKLLGIIRVDDDVHVRASVRLGPVPSP